MLSRDGARSEATLQSDIRQFLLLSSFGLDDDEVRSVNLESPLGDGTRRRIDIEAGNSVIEVKKDLRVGNVRSDAVTQLAGYVQEQSHRLARRYVGILTDGVEWFLYRLTPDGSELSEVAKLVLSPPAADASERLTVWLDTILATAENISPLPVEIERRLGVTSAAYQLDSATLTDLYRGAQGNAEVTLKRMLWAKLLRTSFGTAFTDSDDLFIDHTLLVLTAEIIAHAVIGFEPAEMIADPDGVVSGRLFADAQVHGVVEADFFDWVLDVSGGREFVVTLTQRLARFNWRDVSHDVLKVLYESVITAETRHSLGEYYTPDWLANRIVAETCTEPLNQRVLDPSCGSGTFVFQAIRAYLNAADDANVPNGDALAGLTGHVFGVDVHPVAVTLARVTYLLAIGHGRLSASDRKALSVPVYLGDSVQWDQRAGTLTGDTIRIPTSGNDLSETPTGHLWDEDLVFPESIVNDASRFDQIVTVMADKASGYLSGKVPSVRPALRRFRLTDDELDTLQSTFAVMCHLHATGRDHVWGYYVRNLIRPLWLSNTDANKVDVLVGNVPWLRYAAMTASMQERFADLSHDRQLITTRRGVAGRDLSSLFVVRSVELYLRPEGHFAFVMPRAALTRKPYEGFRAGRWSSQAVGDLNVTFSEPWDLGDVAPDIFPVPSCVALGASTPEGARHMPEATVHWSGRLPAVEAGDWDAVKDHLTVGVGVVRAVTESDVLPESPYKNRFRQGAVLAPRALLFVQERPAGPLGAGAGRTQIEAFRSVQEKSPWKSVATLTGTVENSQLFPTYLGETVLPYRLLDPRIAALPVDGVAFLDDAAVQAKAGFAAWWSGAEALWEAHKKPTDDSRLIDRIDFHGQLSAQFPLGAHRVVYTKAGKNLTAARITNPRAIIDLKLYWATARSDAEAQYLLAILNSETLRSRVEPYQARGLFGPRDFDKYVFRVPIPEFDAGLSEHTVLADLAGKAEQVAASVDVSGMQFQRARKAVRDALQADGVAHDIEKAVANLIPEA